MTNKIFYIYQLRDPRDWRIRYVGRSCRPQKRARDYVRLADMSNRNRWALELKENGIIPKLEILELCAGDGWKEEKKWIRLHRQAGVDLVNIASGGAGAPERPVSKKERLFIANRLKTEWASISPSDRALWCAAIKQATSTPEEKERRSSNAKKQWALMTDEQRDEMRRRISKARKLQYESMTDEQRSEMCNRFYKKKKL